MKTLWLFNHYAQEPGGPGGTRHYSLARYLKHRGWRVIIFASSVEHGTGRQRLLPHESIRIEERGGVTFVWFAGSTYHGNGWARLVSIGQYSLASRKAYTLDLPSPDIVLGSSVHPFAGWVAQSLAKRFRVPFIFEVRDLWPETLIVMGRLRRGSAIALLMRRLETFLYRRASLIITLLPAAHVYISSLGVDAEKVRWLSNGVDISAHPTGLDQRNPGEPFTFMYLGSHGVANGLDSIVEAFSELLLDKTLPIAKLRLIGAGPCKPTLMALASKLQIANAISFEDAVPKAQVPEILSQADAFVVNLRPLDIYRYGISLNKLFDYLAAERPTIIASNAINNPIAEAKAGITASPDDVHEIALGMRTVLLMSAEDRSQMGARGRVHVEQEFDYKSLAGKFAGWLDNLIERRTDVVPVNQHNG